MSSSKMPRPLRFLFENSLFLIIGAVAALIWANSGPAAEESLHHLVHLEFFHNDSNYIGSLHQIDEAHAESCAPREGDPDKCQGRRFDLHYLVNDILMALFFAMAGKEVWEALLPGGPLSNPKKAATPLFATVGGMVGPVFVYLLGAHLFTQGGLTEYGNGWAIPCATDIAFSYMVARIVFGERHPAIPFLLLLAIADDALGLIILAVAYPQDTILAPWLLLSVAGVVAGLVLNRGFKVKSFWPYLLISGTLCWFGFALSGIHPALGLLPMIPTLPHAKSDLGLFMSKELDRHDTLSEFEHWWKNPVEIILFLFGLFNAGVAFSAMGDATFLVLAGLILGKPLGIFGLGMLAAVGFRLGLPEGMNWRDLFVLGCAAAIGFTVALFISGVAFPPGATQDAAKMGALFSFGAAIVTVVAGIVLRVEKVRPSA